MDERLNYLNKAGYYRENDFKDKLVRYAKKAGKKLIETALILYYSMQDADTPKWAKTVILGALGYFVLPFDAVPDFIPVVGLTDDMGALASALAVVAMHIKQDHKNKAKEKLSKIFKEKNTNSVEN